MTHEEIRDKLKRMQRRAKEADEAAERGGGSEGAKGRARLAIEAALDEAHVRGYEDALRDLGVIGGSK